MLCELEFLKPIPEFEGYFASHSGNIYSNKSGSMKMLSLQTDSENYLTCTLYRKAPYKKKNVMKVSILVARAWLPNPDNLPVVDHIDSDRQHNSVNNLEWVSVKENNRRARSNPNFNRYTRQIVQTTLEGNYVAEFESIAKASEATGISGSAITKVLKKKRRTASGFMWFYKEEYKGGIAEQRKHGLCKRVEQYTLDEKFIRVFESITEAAAHVGALRANISNACSGRSKSCKGFIWKYAKQEDEPVADETDDWVTLPEYPLYKISRDGQIYTTHLKRLKIQTRKKNGGYPSVLLVDKNGRKSIGYIHILVAKAYVPNPDNLPWVNHIDGDTTNSKAENLEWCTPKQNAQHAHDNDLCSSRKITIQCDLDGNEIKRFPSLKEAADSIGVSTNVISRICRGKVKNNIAGGYKWSYLDE